MKANLNQSKLIFWKHTQIQIIVLTVCFGMMTHAGFAQSRRLLRKANKASVNFVQKASVGTDYKFKYDTILVDPQLKKIKLVMNESFSYIPFRVANTNEYDIDFKKILGRKFRKYSVSIESIDDYSRS